MRLIMRQDVFLDVCEKLGLIEKSHKYIRRWMKDGKWNYEYPSLTGDKSGKSRKSEKISLSMKSPVVDTVLPLKNPNEESIGREFEKLRRMSKEGKLRVKAYGNFPVVINKKSERHLNDSKGRERLPEVVAERASFLPFIPEILNRTGVIGEKTMRKEGVVFGILGRCKINGTVKTVEVSLAFDKNSNLFFLSNYEIKKALSLTLVTENESLEQPDSTFSWINILD